MHAHANTGNKSFYCVIFSIIGLEELARYPNVYCKVSGFFAADPSWSIQKYVETAVKPCLEIFGMDRC